MRREITIWSEGTRMAGDLFVPEDEGDGKRPAILLCHGWGGPKEHLNNTYAPRFCEAGFVCVTFDYRGWFESDSRLVTMEKQPPPDDEGYVTVRAKPVREIVDPLDQNRDIYNVLDYMMGETCIDTDRIGLWGSSFGGGHVIHVGASDRRIKCIVSQVPGMGQPENLTGAEAQIEAAWRLGTRMARGEIDTIPRPDSQPEALRGVGDQRTMLRYFPRAAARKVRVPILIIDQEEEEYGGRENSGLAAYEAVKGNAICKYHVFPGTHYDIYSKNFEASADMARDWFLEHL
jgi:dienelactone hydrolase